MAHRRLAAALLHSQGRITVGMWALLACTAGLLCSLRFNTSSHRLMRAKMLGYRVLAPWAALQACRALCILGSSLAGHQLQIAKPVPLVN